MPPSDKTPPAKIKQIAKHLGTAYRAAKLLYKVAEYFEYIEVYEQKTDALGHPVKDYLHRVDLTDSEKEHLRKGGKLVVVHACGKELHVQVPRVI